MNHVDRRFVVYDIRYDPPDFVCSGCGLRIPRAGRHEQHWWAWIMDHWNRVHPERRMKA